LEGCFAPYQIVDPPNFPEPLFAMTTRISDTMEFYFVKTFTFYFKN